MSLRSSWILVLGTLFWLSLTRCAIRDPDVATLNNQNISFTEMVNIVHQMIPVGIRKESPNGREFTSQYYILEKKEYQAAKDASVRYWCKVTILNGTRPYDLEFEVHKEERIDEDGRIQFYETGLDFSLAKMLRDQFRDRLAKRRDDLNLLDDFRVF